MIIAVFVTISLIAVAQFSEVPIMSLGAWRIKSWGGEDDVNSSGRHRKLDGLTMLEQLPSEVIPTAQNGRRLIIVGDIHGMDKSFEKLLKHISYDGATDHIVAAGDMVNKGPHSSRVIARLMELGASAVRGNHEDRILLALASHDEQEAAGLNVTYPDYQVRRSSKPDLETARQLSREQIKWLAQRPLILSADALAMYVVHAGLVPGIRPAKQDPWAVMNMRSLIEPPPLALALPVPEEDDFFDEESNLDDEDYDDNDDGDDAQADIAPAELIPVDTHEGLKWARLWDRRQSRIRKASRRTVVYGHDAKRGLTVGKYTFGLDSACVNGGELTALIVQLNKKGDLTHKIRQVSCKKYKR